MSRSTRRVWTCSRSTRSRSRCGGGRDHAERLPLRADVPAQAVEVDPAAKRPRGALFVRVVRARAATVSCLTWTFWRSLDFALAGVLQRCATTQPGGTSIRATRVRSAKASGAARVSNTQRKACRHVREKLR